jgi:chemotaxis family two-component system sensor kinase Cph1
MAVHEITNKDLINLVNCEREPIHIPGSIQPHGFLLILQGADLLVTFCSANIETFIGYTPAGILGKPLGIVFPETEMIHFREYLARYYQGTGYPHIFTLNDIPYNTTVHKTDDNYLLECEPFPDGHLSLPDLYAQTRNFISLIEGADYLQDLCQSVAGETRNITGYDRVMIYRFDKDYNGEVYAEAKREDLDSFLDHRYPHTDIPVQARILYLRNLLRMIVDVNYEPVPLLTLDTEATHADADLSNSVLRSVSPMHIEYLKNMGVVATLTISLIHKGQLWGLIACHHYSAKNLPHYTRLAARMQGHFLTSQISVREVKEEYDLTTRTEAHLQLLQQQLLRSEHFIDEYYNAAAIPGLGNATGVIISYEGQLYRNGKTPDDTAVKQLIHWLATNAVDGVLETDQLAMLSPDFEEIAEVASGIIYHSLGKNGTDCIIWFRPEVVQTLNWAGDPNKAILNGEDGMRLTPRKSFDLWREEVKFRSIPWKKPELNATASFAYALQRHVLYRYLSLEERKYRKQSEKLQDANDELANINWIGTHDLKEPLRKIQIFGSLIQESKKDKLSSETHAIIEKMRNAAARMQLLLDDILAYSQISSREQAFTETDLNALLAEVQSSLKEEIEQQHAVIHADKLPVIQGIDFQLRQLFVNLISNALKFVRADNTPRLLITCLLVQAAELKEQTDHRQYYKIDFRDNGIGFEEAYSSRIFDVFQRLHGITDYQGTGVGLAICRKIMTNHHGYIKANGVLGVGATFTLYFPYKPELVTA